MRQSGRLPSEADEVIISVNPKAGASSSELDAGRLAQLLEAEGLSVEILSDLDAVAEQANRLHREGRLRALVGVGGDGTAAELVNATEQGVPITMLPAGRRTFWLSTLT